MAHAENLARLQQIFSRVFSGVQITENTSMQNLLEWDSLNHLTLVLAIEKEFAIKFKPNQLAKITSVKQILASLG